jgi:pimeloyl-ACP methyl ester carboxylesterase
VAVILLNSGLQHRVGPFRLYVQLARRLASLGFPVLRIDQSGKGDSERRKDVGFLDSIEADFEDAAEFLGKTIRAQTFVLVGLCSGADDALYIASKHREVGGVVLLDGYAARTVKYYYKYYAARALQWRPWSGFLRRALALIVPGRASGVFSMEPTPLIELQEPVGPAEMRRRFASAQEGGRPFLCIFTSGVEDYYNYQGQLTDWLGTLGRQSVREVFIEGAEHTYPLITDRLRLFELIGAWMKEVFSDRLAAPAEPTGLSASPPDAVSAGAATTGNSVSG